MCSLSSFVSLHKERLIFAPSYSHQRLQSGRFLPAPAPTAWWVTHSFMTKLKHLLFRGGACGDHGGREGVGKPGKHQCHLGAMHCSLLPILLLSFSPLLVFSIWLLWTLPFSSTIPAHQLSPPIFSPWRLSCTLPKTSFTTWPSSGAPQWTLLCYFTSRNSVLVPDKWYLFPSASLANEVTHGQIST